MRFFSRFDRRCVRAAAIFCLVVLGGLSAPAQKDANSSNGKEIYRQIKALAFGGGSADVSGLVLTRDRVTMTFSGTFHFASPVEGRVTAAVFNGTGTFRVEMPPNEFEKNNVKRLLDADTVESEFKTAVLRFTDATF